MNPAAPHRATLTVLVALAAAAVVAGVVALSPTIERLMPRLPAMPTTAIAFGLAAVGLLVFAVWAVAQLSRAVRTRARRTALAATVRGELSSGIRNRLLVQRLNEVANADRPVRLGARYSIVVDELGVAFWNSGGPAAAGRPVPVARGAQHPRRLDGGRRSGRPRRRAARAAQRRERRAAHHPVVGSPRAIRAGRCALPSGGAQLEGEATHRARREGLEPPPLTAPIPIITPRMAAAAAADAHGRDRMTQGRVSTASILCRP